MELNNPREIAFVRPKKCRAAPRDRPALRPPLGANRAPNFFAALVARPRNAPASPITTALLSTKLGSVCSILHSVRLAPQLHNPAHLRTKMPSMPAKPPATTRKPRREAPTPLLFPANFVTIIYRRPRRTPEPSPPQMWVTLTWATIPEAASIGRLNMK